MSVKATLETMALVLADSPGTAPEAQICQRCGKPSEVIVAVMYLPPEVGGKYAVFCGPCYTRSPWIKL